MNISEKTHELTNGLKPQELSQSRGRAWQGKLNPAGKSSSKAAGAQIVPPQLPATPATFGAGRRGGKLLKLPKVSAHARY